MKLASNSPLFTTVLVNLIYICLIKADDLLKDFQPPVALKLDKKIVNCLVCRALVDEVEAAIEQVDPYKKVEIGSFRLDGSGNTKLQSIPYARSQLHLSELMDRVCGNFKEYVLGTYKSTGKVTLIRLTNPDGNMNSEISNIDISSNPEINDKLSYYCQNLVEDHEDDIISMFSKSEKEPHHKLCVEIAPVCPQEASDKGDSETYTFEHEDL